MSAGVLAGLEPIPVPGGAALIVARQLPDFECGRVVPLRRQRQQRRLRTQGLGQIHDPQPASGKFFEQCEPRRETLVLLTSFAFDTPRPLDRDPNDAVRSSVA